MHYNEYAYLLHRARKVASDMAEADVDDDSADKKTREVMDQISAMGNCGDEDERKEKLRSILFNRSAED